MGIIDEGHTEKMDLSKTLKEAQTRTVLSLGKNRVSKGLEAEHSTGIPALGMLQDRACGGA